MTRRMLASKVTWILLFSLVLAGACAPTPGPALSTSAAQPTAAPMATRAVVVMTVAPQMVTMVPAATSAPKPTGLPAAGTLVPGPSGGPGLPAVPYAQDRMIVKSGEMDLLVVDTDVALGGVTQAAIDMGGYILSGRSWFQDNFKFAQITIGVPSDQYEAALIRLRRLGIQVLRETSSGQDVTDEFVDLDSRLRNLQSQADRLRAFMAQAQNVQEAITVSQSLTDVENQIEQIKGRMNYLQGRSAFSTITVNLEPQRPTPTPTMTPTNTPTPTPTFTPTPEPTPTPWDIGTTIQKAGSTSGIIWQNLFELAIWFLVVGGPFVLVVGIPLGVWRWRAGRRPPPGPA